MRLYGVFSGLSILLSPFFSAHFQSSVESPILYVVDKAVKDSDKYVHVAGIKAAVSLAKINGWV